jgi:hypothetical protein
MSFICRLNMAGTHGWTYNIILRSFVHFPISQLLQVYLYYQLNICAFHSYRSTFLFSPQALTVDAV